VVAELPTIPERHLLAAFLELEADLTAIAARTRTPLDDLTRWANNPDVRAWLNAFQDLAAKGRESREIARITRTLDSLEKLHATTEHPVEKRRLLNTIIRASTAILNGVHRHRRGLATTPRKSSQDEPTATELRTTPIAPELHEPPRSDTLKSKLPARPAPINKPEPARAAPAPTIAPPSHSPQNFSPTTLPPLYTQDFSLRLPKPSRAPARSPARLLAAAGLPAP
jgi:hypothetical protein